MPGYCPEIHSIPGATESWRYSSEPLPLAAILGSPCRRARATSETKVRRVIRVVVMPQSPPPGSEPVKRARTHADAQVVRDGSAVVLAPDRASSVS